ncbi:MAG: hypothetical protein AB1730_23395 [Myxococcota bacterium]
MSAPELPSEVPPSPATTCLPVGPPVISGDAAAVLAGTVLGLGAVRPLVIGPKGTCLTSDWPAETFELNDWRGRLPFGDGTFDAVVLCTARALPEVDFLAVARECLRVAQLAVVHVEPTDEARLSRLVAGWTSVATLTPLRRRLAGAEMLLVRKPMAAGPDAEALAEALVAERAAVARLRTELDEVRAALKRSRDELSRWREAPATRLARTLSDNCFVRAASRRTLSAVRRARNALRAYGLAWPPSYADDPVPVDGEDDLRFGGVAHRASPSDPEAFLNARPRVVSLCHPDWRGIRAATYEQCEHVIEVAGFKTRAHARRLAGFLQDCGTERVIMNGFPPGTELFGEALHQVAPGIRFSIVYHGTPALTYGEDAVLQYMIELFERGFLYKLGFVKHGLAEYFRGRGCRAEYVMNLCRLPALAPAPPPADGRTRIGVFAPSVPHKNVETQLLSALMIPGGEVHTIEPVKARYLQAELHRVVFHGLLPRPEFLSLLRSMHATSYVSLVECYPMTVLESIYSGAVCLTSNTSVIFQDDPVLQKALVVEHHDSPAAIARKLSQAIEQRSELVPRAQRHLDLLNQRAERRWAEFIDD